MARTSGSGMAAASSITSSSAEAQARAPCSGDTYCTVWRWVRNRFTRTTALRNAGLVDCTSS